MRWKAVLCIMKPPLDLELATSDESMPGEQKHRESISGKVWI